MNYHVASELFWYIRPEFRSLGAGKALLVGLEEAARKEGVEFLAMMVLCDAGDPERAAAIYTANGYQRSEMTFMKRMSWPQSQAPQSQPLA
jgi:GNAT superfamily N-acetyltransferase